MKMNRLAAALSLVIIALASSAWVIKDTANPVEIYSGTNTSPTISAATNGAVSLGVATNQTNNVKGALTVTGDGAVLATFVDTTAQAPRLRVKSGSGEIEVETTYSSGGADFAMRTNSTSNDFIFRAGSPSATEVGRINGDGPWVIGSSGYTGTHTINGKLTISQLATCSGADLCASNFTTSISAEGNNAIATTCNPVYFMKLGATVNAGVRCLFQPSSGTTGASFRMTVPLASGNFAQSYRANGNCVVDGANGSQTHHWSIEAVAGTQTVQAYNSYPNYTGARGIMCTYLYEIP